MIAKANSNAKLNTNTRGELKLPHGESKLPHRANSEQSRSAVRHGVLHG